MFAEPSQETKPNLLPQTFDFAKLVFNGGTLPPLHADINLMAFYSKQFFTTLHNIAPFLHNDLPKKPPLLAKIPL